MTFVFTADSSGSKDAVTIPTEITEGTHVYFRLRIRPPAGHAWSYSRPNATSESMPRDMDQELIIEQRAPFHAGEIPLYVALDSGTGTFYADLE